MFVNRFLKWFHEQASYIRIRISALGWYLGKNKILLFSFSYILFNFLLLTYLKNNFEGIVIGFIISLLLLIVTACIRFYLHLGTYETNANSLKGREYEYSLLTILDIFFVIVLAMFSCFVRLTLFVKNENSSILKVESFTNKFECFELEINKNPSENVDGTQYYMKILSDNTEVGISNGLTVLVSLPSFPNYGVGDICEVCGTILRPENFSDFDYREFLMNKRVYGILKATSYDCNLKKHVSINSILYAFKENLVLKLERSVVEPQVSLLAGIIFGEDRPFSDEFETMLRNSGTSHIVAASGYNVTILVLMIERLFKFIDKKYRNLLSLLIIWLFCIMSGMSASIVRASIMGSFSLLAVLSGRYYSIHRILIIGIWLFILVSPIVIFDVGFQLSVSATLGLIYLSSSIEGYLERKRIKHTTFFMGNMLPTISCTLCTLPVSILNFGIFTFTGIIANTLILPVLESTMLWGVLGLIFSYVSFNLARIFFAVSFVQLKYFEFVVTKLGNLDFLIFEPGNKGKVIISSMVIVVLLLFTIKEYPIDNESFNYYFRLARKSEY